MSDLHLVFHLTLLRVATGDFVVDDNIKVTIISGVGSTVKGALNDISFLELKGVRNWTLKLPDKTHGNSEGLRGVEDGLFPVSVLTMALALSTL